MWHYNGCDEKLSGERMTIFMPACSCSYRLNKGTEIALVTVFFFFSLWNLHLTGLMAYKVSTAYLQCQPCTQLCCLWNAPCLGATQMSLTPLFSFMGGAELQRASSCAAAPSPPQPAATAPPALALTLQSCWDLEHFWERSCLSLRLPFLPLLTNDTDASIPI